MAEHHDGVDHLVAAYYTAISRRGSAHYARMAIAESRLTSSSYLDDRARALIAELDALDAAADPDDDSDDRPDEVLDELRAIADNPNVGVDVAWTLYGHPNGALHQAAAANSALGADNVHTLWRQTRDGFLLANPWTASGTVTAHWELDPAAAAFNPNASTAVLRCCVGYPQARRAALQHPRLPDDLVERALRHATSPNGWHSIVRNRDRVTAYQLVDLQQRIMNGEPDGLQHDHEVSQSTRVRMCENIHNEIDERHWGIQPGDRPTTRLRGAEVPDPIADVLRTGGDHADAIIALLRAGFDGTVADLVDVAASVTDSQHGARAAAT